MATAHLAGQQADGRGSQAVAFARPPSELPACTKCMSAMRAELHHLADLLPEAGLRPAPGLIRAHAAGDHGPETDLPFTASSETDPDPAGRVEEILAPEPDR